MRNPTHISPASKRSSNIELLRIIAMLMIVAHHLSVHGGLSFGAKTISANRFWILFLEIGGKTGVNIFVLISGYFSVTAKSIKISKALKLWLQLSFYSVMLYLVTTLCGAQAFNIVDFIKTLLPITFSQWWFASAYFVLFLISPYINRLLHTFSKSEYRRFLALLFFLWCVISTFLPVSLYQAWQSNNLLWFIVLYSLAGYFRLHADLAAVSSTRYILTGVVLIAATYLSAVVISLLGTKITALAIRATYFYQLQRLPAALIAICLFIGFAALELRHSPAINLIASAAFGVYLIHDNGWIRPVLWKSILNMPAYQDSSLLIPHSLFAIVFVFFVCSIVELLRIRLVEKHYLKLLDSISERIQRFLDALLSIEIFKDL